MNTARTLAIAALTMASIPLMAQTGSTPQQPGATSPGVTNPGAASPTQTQPAQTQQQMAPQSTQAPAASAAVELKPVDGELVDKLDTKTAKTGDAVVIKTKSNVTTADGKQIPKGSKLVGKVVGVKPIGAGNENSQVALQFDHVELKGGQNMPVHAELQALSTDSGSAGAGSAEATPSTAGATTSTTAGASAPSGSMNGSSAAATQSPAATQPQMSSNGTSAGSSAAGSSAGSSAGSTAAASGPAPGTVVARTGNIAIKTTSIPGVLLATNEPGQQDPRMAQSSGILLGPKHDIHLDGGTQVVVGLGTSSTVNPGGGN